MAASSLTLFEVHLAPGTLDEELLSAEVKKETNAQVMTVAEAKKKGFGGLPDLPSNVRLISVGGRDVGWIQKVLEAHHAVSGFKVHHVG